MKLDSLEAIQLGDTVEWIRVRATDPANPVLLLIQQGPGLPMLNEVPRFERLLALSQDFTVVYWDQRGCGRSLRANTPQANLTVERMVDDTVTLLERLADRFGTQPYVAGFSLGATIGAHASARRPDLVAALVAVGIDIDGVAAANNAYDFALTTARRRGNRRAVRDLEAIGAPPHARSQFGTRVRWVTEFGGVTGNETYNTMVRKLVVSLVRSPDYSVADVVRAMRGIVSTPAALAPELATLDLVQALPRLDVPIVLAQGRLDQVSPGEAAQRYFDVLEAPSKELVWFEHSAHTPQLEEPAKFRQLLLRVRAGQPGATRDVA